MINEFDNEIDNYIKSNPPKLAKLDPIDQATQGIEQTKEANFKINEMKVADTPPDLYNQYYEVSKREKLPLEFVKNNWDTYKKKEIDYKGLRLDSPKTAKWLEKEENLGLFKDDIEYLKKLENSSSKAEQGFFGEQFLAFKQGLNSVATNSVIMAYTYGALDEKSGAEYIAAFEKTQNELNEETPFHVKQFQELAEKEGNDVNKATKLFFQGYDEMAEGKLLEGLTNLAEGGGSTLLQSLDMVYTYGVNPRATAFMITQNLPNALPSIAGGIAGGAGGASIGAVPGAIIGAGIGGATGSALTEIPASLKADLVKAGVDFTDPNAIMKAFRNKTLIDNAKERGIKKGVTTAAVDGLFNMFGGSILKSVKGVKGVKLKALAVGKELGVQAAGEVISEGAGQFAREGDIRKVDVAESLQEGIISFGQSGSDVLVGAKIRGALSDSNLKNLKESVKTYYSSIKDRQSISGLNDTIENIKESPMYLKNPEKVTEFLGENMTGEVYFQSDDFDALFGEDESPIEKADELLPGGREQYLKAKEEGSHIEIPKSHFVTNLGSKVEGSIDRVRMNPEGLNLVESQAVDQDFESFVKEMAVKAKEELIQDRDTKASFEDVKQDLTFQLTQAGINQSTAEMYAEAFQPIRVMAERLGRNPYELYSSLGLKINKVKTGEGGVNVETPQNKVDFLVKSELDNLAQEINEATKGERVISTNEKGEKNVVGISSTFPQWFRDLGFKSKADFFKTFNSKNKKTKRYQRLLALIEDRLINGYESTTLGQVMPQNDFRLERGLEAIEGGGNLAEDEKAFFHKEKGEKPKGQIRISTNREFSIDLFEGADRSTFLHEAGHLFLEVFGDLASSPDTPSQFAGDYKEILKYLGVENRDQIKRKHHEKWARAFETYLSNGKAPSKDLQSAFRQFRIWLSALYARLLKKRVKLTKEVTSVMDRMFASEQEIRELQAEMLADTIEYKAQTEKITDNKEQAIELAKAHAEATFAAEEELIQKQMEKYAKTQTTQYKAVEAEIKKEARAELEQERLYSGIAKLKEDNTKINTKALRETVGEETYKQMPKGYTSNTGIDPVIAADIMGYTSISEFVAELNSNPTLEIAVENLTTQRMDQLYPELSDLQGLRDEAIDAVHNNQQSALKRKELDWLWENSPAKIKEIIRKIGSRIPSLVEVKRMAEREVLTKTVKELSPYKYFQKENHHRKEAMAAFTRGDFAQMYEHKKQEYLNHEYYKLAKEHRENQTKFVSRMKALFRKPKDKLANNYEMNYLNIVRETLSNFGLIKATERQEKTLRQYFDTLERVAPNDYEKVKELKVVLAEMPLGDYRELTLQQYDDLIETLDMFTTLAKEDKEIESLTDKANVNDVIGQALANMAGIPKHKLTGVNDGYFKSFFYGAAASLTRMEHLLEKWDGTKFNGVLKKYIFNPLREAQTNYFRQLLDKTEILNNILDQRFKDIFKNKKEIDISKYIPGATGIFRQHQIVMMVLHSGNESNLRKLLLGYKWGSLDLDSNLDSTAYKNFLDKMYQDGILTDDILAGVQEIWDLLETMKPGVQTAFKKVYGRFMGEIEPQAITIGGVTLKGGYMPAITDPLFVESAGKRENEIAFKQEEAKFAYSGPAKGFTKDRAENYTEPLLLDFKLIKGHIEHTVKFSTLAVAANNTYKVLKNRKFRDGVHQINPRMMSDTFDAWLGRFAMQRTEKVGDTDFDRHMAEAARYLRRNAVSQIMVGNVRNAVENLTDLPAFLAKVKYRSMQESLVDYVANPKELIAEMYRLSSFMEQRQTDGLREVQEQYHELTITQSGPLETLKGVQRVADKHGFMLQKFTGNIVEVIGWHGAFKDAVAQGLNDKEAAVYANSVIATVAGGSTALDVATIEAQGAVAKSFMAFYGYFLNKGNALYYAENRAKAFPFYVTIPSILASLLYRAFTGKADEDEDGEYVDDALSVLVGSQLNFLVATIPYAGAVARFAADMFSENKFVSNNSKINLSPLISTVEKAKGVVNLVTRDNLRSRDVKDTMSFIGLISGLPIGAPILRNPVGYMIDVNQGKQNPEDIIDYARGFTTGRSE